jgi:dTDP-glucose 4,6-dehydratase
VILVTGGAGFIGSNFILNWFKSNTEPVVNLDKLTYAANSGNLESIANNPNYEFIKGDITDGVLISALLKRVRPRAILHFAAESHVDRSLLTPGAFIKSNIIGTFQLLEATRIYLQTCAHDSCAAFRFIHISTDEVFGSLDEAASPATEQNVYSPNNLYSASKASSDHLVRAYNKTYGLPTTTIHSSNNYGPRQFTEKFIPHMIVTALKESPMTVYADGAHIRDWLYVDDNADAIMKVLNFGTIGDSYNVGGGNEKTNLDVVHSIVYMLDNLKPRRSGLSYLNLIKHIKDRPGHDRRYALDSTKIKLELNWKPRVTFDQGLKKTIDWYMNAFLEKYKFD